MAEMSLFMRMKTIYKMVGSIGLMFLLVAGCREAPSSSASEVGAEPRRGEADDRPVVLFVGDSLTAGYQLDPADAYPALIQSKIDVVGGSHRVVNAGVSGDTSADGRNRIDWLLRQPVDVFVLALGANDALRGLPIHQLRDNLTTILEATRSRHPEARLVIAGMRMPTNYGETYTRAFEQVFRDVANTFDANLIPFLLEGVGGNPALNLADGIHPNEAGHRVIAETVWHQIAPLLAD